MSWHSGSHCERRLVSVSPRFVPRPRGSRSGQRRQKHPTLTCHLYHKAGAGGKLILLMSRLSSDINELQCLTQFDSHFAALKDFNYVIFVLKSFCIILVHSLVSGHFVPLCTVFLPTSHPAYEATTLKL